MKKQVIRLTENDLHKIIENSVKKIMNEIMLGQGESFTPYSPQEREQNFKGLTQMRNVGYDNFRKWRENELKKGRKPIELGWNTYMKEKDI